MSLLRRRGLTIQLFLLLVVPLTALLLLIAFGSTVLHQSAMRSMVGERDERAARAAAVSLTTQLDQRATAVAGLAGYAAAISPDHALAVHDFLQPYFDGGLALFSPDGQLLAASDTVVAPHDWPLDALLAQAAAGDGVRFGQPFALPGIDRLLSLVAAGTPDGPVAVGAFAPDNLAQHALANIITGEQPVAFVMDQTGQLLYQAGDLHHPVNSLADHAGVPEALRGESGTTYIVVNGHEHVVAYSPVPPVGWALVIEEPWHTVVDSQLQLTQLAPLILAPVLLLALVALWFGGRQVIRPLQNLEQLANQLAWGNFAAIEAPVGGIDEIQHLQTTLIQMAQKVKMAQQSLRSYVGAITAGQEEERRRLARELHDDTIQSLIALNQRIQMAQLSLEGEEATAVLTELQTLTTQMIADVRRFARALRPIYLEDLGLIPALDALAKDIAEAGGLAVDCQIVGTPQRLGTAVELTLYRTAQEALKNVTRHAQATQARIRLTFTPDQIRLSIQDDGRGFAVPDNPAELAPQGHFGLLGLYERAELIGAHLKIESKPGHGTEVTLLLPTYS
jgi:signal transduction histidine kinase